LTAGGCAGGHCCRLHGGPESGTPQRPGAGRARHIMPGQSLGPHTPQATHLGRSGSPGPAFRAFGAQRCATAMRMPATAWRLHGWNTNSWAGQPSRSDARDRQSDQVFESLTELRAPRSCQWWERDCAGAFCGPPCPGAPLGKSGGSRAPPQTPATPAARLISAPCLPTTQACCHAGCQVGGRGGVAGLLLQQRALQPPGRPATAASPPAPAHPGQCASGGRAARVQG